VLSGAHSCSVLIMVRAYDAMFHCRLIPALRKNAPHARFSQDGGIDVQDHKTGRGIWAKRKYCLLENFE
jgi:hypothetical protein